MEFCNIFANKLQTKRDDLVIWSPVRPELLFQGFPVVSRQMLTSNVNCVSAF